MNQQGIIAELEARARVVGLTMAEVCKRAGIHPTTFSRWKLSERNPHPIGATLVSLNKLDGAISAVEQSPQSEAAA